jgi:hypothetical protein
VKVATGLGLLGFAAVQAGCAAVAPEAGIKEENYDFLSVTGGPCVPYTERKDRTDCGRMTEQRRYRGTWFVAFETSVFTPIGRQGCFDTDVVDCAELEGKALPWPSRWACPRLFEVEFVGRRNVWPGFYYGSEYKIVVDKLISAKRLPDPSHEPGECVEDAL